MTNSNGSKLTGLLRLPGPPEDWATKLNKNLPVIEKQLGGLLRPSPSTGDLEGAISDLRAEVAALRREREADGELFLQGLKIALSSMRLPALESSQRGAGSRPKRGRR